MITFTIPEYSDDDTSVEITFFNEDNLINKRIINIPHNSDGTVDEDYFIEIIEGQIRGLEHKVKVGVASFKDPSEFESNVGISST